MKLHRKHSIALMLLIVLILIFFIVPVLSQQSWFDSAEDWVSEHAQNDDDADEQDNDDEQEQSHQGAVPLTVTFDDDALDYIGVETMSVYLSAFSPELKTHAYVVDTTELVKWQLRLHQAQAMLTVANVAAESAYEELKRIQKLAKSAGSVASKNISYAEATWKEKAAQRQVAEVDLANINIELVQVWGKEIAEWVQAKNQEKFKQLLQREQALLVLALPIGATSPESNNAKIYVSPTGDRASAQPASYVSPAYTNVTAIQSETYYLLTKAEHLRSGMRLDAWLTSSQNKKQGFFIPEAAIVWYAGQPWAYVEVEKGTYKRKALSSGTADEQGIFMQSEFSEGDALVVSGSQMLLSEEFRWQIHDEDDDD